MQKNALTRLRPLVTFGVMFSFLIIAASGLLLFFHCFPFGNPGRWKVIHEWFSIVFLAFSAIHVSLNWNVLMQYFRRPAAWRQWAAAALACGLVMSLLMIRPLPQRQGPPSERPPLEQNGGNEIID